MLYLSGVHALNIENTLNTCGDWHTSALDWSSIKLEESSNSIFGDWGIEMNKSIPEHTELYNVADDLRAINVIEAILNSLDVTNFIVDLDRYKLNDILEFRRSLNE